MNEATWARLRTFGSKILADFKNTGYSRQLLTIGVTECDEEDSDINWFFRCIQNFELNIFISSMATERNAKTYLDALAAKIASQKLSHIEFSKRNSLFKTNRALGFIIDNNNKNCTGEFRYRLFLPQQSHQKEKDDDKTSLRRHTPIRVAQFEE